MIILGLLVGPALGLLAGDFLFREGSSRGRWGVMAVAPVLLVLLVLPVGSVELRIGLVAGAALGVLLTTTPLALDVHTEAE